MDDRTAFLRAITEQPADHTARLVFADFLDETGAAADAVWAEFIRTQVEAETVHPNSNRAADVERRARELCAAHWLDWWAPVCAGVGLPLPYRPAGGVRGWLARNVLATGVKPGDPYTAPRAHEHLEIGVPTTRPAPLNALSAVRFAGGFPESLAFLGQLTGAAEVLRRWPGVSPLARLELCGVVARDWRAIDGPHLNGLRALELKFGAATLLDALGRSPHLSQLEELRLVPDRSNSTWGEQQYRALAAALLAERVKRLKVEIAVPAETRALAGIAFRNLTGLEIRFYLFGVNEPSQRAVVNGVAELLGAARLDELEELALDATTSAAVWHPDWPRLPRLRRLALCLPGTCAPRPFPFEGLFPALTDLTVAFGRIRDWLGALAPWPGIARLRHFRLLSGGRIIVPKAVPALLRLVRELDPERLETLRISSRVCNAETVCPALAERFGDRVRFG
jgi:uncharacterized protein (TIGR02996 family)